MDLIIRHCMSTNHLLYQNYTWLGSRDSRGQRTFTQQVTSNTGWLWGTYAW